MAVPVLAVDVGSATITAAAATPSKTPSPEVLHFNGQPDYPSAAKVDIEGTPHPATWNGYEVELVRQPTLLLDKPPQIINDVPLSGATLLAVSIGPAIAAARTLFGDAPDTIIGVHPDWPAATITDYRRGLARQGTDVVLVAWADAIAAQTTAPLTGSHVTVLDFGSSTASVVVVAFSRCGTPSVAYTRTDPHGGARGAHRAVIADCAHRHAVPLASYGQDWWTRAEHVITTARRGARDGDTVTLTFADPLGSCELSWHDFDQLIATHMRTVICGLTDDDAVQHAWQTDRTDTTAPPILEATGGFAADPAVELAVRTAIGPVTVVDEPAAAAAFGAVMMEAPKWVPAPPPARRRSLVGRRSKGAQT